MKTKVCTKCHTRKRFIAFHRRSVSKNGRAPWCKSCIAAYSVAHRPEITIRRAVYHAARREFDTAYNHYHVAHNPTARQYHSHKNMVFYAAWDTAKGTPKACAVFAHHAKKWMLLNCKCPSEGWELHVDKTHRHPFGYFGPSGIRWMPKMDRHQQMELNTALKICEKNGYTMMVSNSK